MQMNPSNSLEEILKNGESLQTAVDFCAQKNNIHLVLSNNAADEFCFCSCLSKAFSEPAACRAALREAAATHGEEKSVKLNSGQVGRIFPLRYGNRSVGLALCLGKNLDPIPLNDLERYALVVCAMAEGWNAVLPAEDEVVRTLLEQDFVSKVESKALLQQAGLYDLTSYRMLFLFSDRGDKERAMVQLKLLLEEKHLPVALSVHRGIPILLTSGEPDIRSDPTLWEGLGRITRECHVYLFLSSLFGEISRVREIHKLALFLWQGVTEVTPDIVFMDVFNPLGLILSSRLESKQLMEYCAESLLRIQRFDEENGTHYLRTLQAYLILNHNVKQTGALLYVHPNTVQYRINRIQELFDIDLKNSMTVHNLMMSYDILLFTGEVEPI